MAGKTKRGAATALAGSAGQIGGVVSAMVFPESDSPQQYARGISVCIGFQAVGVLAALNMWFWCAYENRLRDLPEARLGALGERHPDFRYTT